MASSLCCALLAACQTPLSQLQTLAAEQGREVGTLHTAAFTLAYSAPVSPPGETLRVYLEGDGRAWATRSQPSLDPSPRDLLVARLTFADPQPSLYLARPCQYQKTANCHPAVWTNRRYAPEIVDSLDQALDQVKVQYGNRSFELIGYSGGATLALLLAARRDDIARVQTLAGNLSPRRWVALKQLSPLEGSLEPLDQRERLARVPQRHLLGDADTLITPELLDYYRQTLGPAACLDSAVLKGVEHAKGWSAAWASWRARPLSCRP